MALIKDIPLVLEEKLSRIGLDAADAVLTFQTDINKSGRHEPQWIVTTEEQILVFGAPLEVLFFSEIKEFRTQNVVGSGLIQARIDGVWIDIIRFSNRLKYQADRLLKRLIEQKRGLPITPMETDEIDPQRCRQCGLMLEFQGELCPRCIDHGAALSRVFRMLHPYWKGAAAMLVLLLAGVGLDMIWPLLTRFLVDWVLVSEPPSREPPFGGWLLQFGAPTLLIMVVGALGLVHIVRGLINLITGMISGRVGNALTFDIRSALVRKLEELGLAFYNKQETGSLVGRIAYDTEAVYGFLNQLTSGFLMQFFLVLISFGMMFSLEPTLALWAIVPAPFVIGGAFAYWRYVHPRYQRFWDRSAKQAGLLNGILSGIRVVKAFGREDYELDRFQKASGEVRSTKTSLDHMNAYFYPVMAIVFQVGGWIVWYIGGHRVLGAEISLGTLMAFFGYLSMFYGPLGSLTNLTTWLTQFSTQMHRIFDIMDTPVILPETPEPVKKETRSGDIRLHNVSFGYSRGNPVLHDINIHIRPGERVGIVGRSGSGKTSLVNLIARFYDVDSGRILIDGIDIRRLSKQDLRSHISMVLQEPFLFRGTLAENIAYGRPAEPLNRVLSAARAANAHDFIMNHPLAYDTSVGERGSTLSGGERQRISIARALLCEAPILVLDEATSALDSESEQSIQSALGAADGTAIIIAHRLSTLRNCDRIYVIENGRIQEEGTHRELMNLGGLYEKWVMLQQGGPHSSDQKEAPDSKGQEDHLPRWLDPVRHSFMEGSRDSIDLIGPDGEAFRGIFALRCFPIHWPDRFISIRFVDADNRVREAGMITDLSHWPAKGRLLVEKSLKRRYFFHEVTRIYSMRKLGQFLSVAARTPSGRVEFMVRDHQESAESYGRDGKLLIDVEKNLYLIPSLTGLPKGDRSLLSRHIYW